MPGYRGHLVGGGVTFAAIYYTTTKILSYPQPTIKQLFFALAFCLLGSLFPDIDTKSVGQRIFYFILAFMIISAIISKQWNTLSVLSLLSLFPILVNHRGIIHSIWFVTLVPLIIPFIISYNSPQFANSAWTAYGYFVAGALSHLLLDYGLIETIKRPFSKKR